MTTTRASSRKAGTSNPVPVRAATPTPESNRGRRASSNSPTKANESQPGSPVAVDAPHRWTFLTNHAHVLIVLHAQPGIVLREVAVKVGITERAVQRILHDLEEAGIILREKVGRQNVYEVVLDQRLRHPIEAHRKIGDLLKLISG